MCPFVYVIRTEEDTREGRPCFLFSVVYPQISGGNDCGLVHIFGQDSRQKEILWIHTHVTKMLVTTQEYSVSLGYWLSVPNFSFFIAESYVFTLTTLFTSCVWPCNLATEMGNGAKLCVATALTLGSDETTLCRLSALSLNNGPTATAQAFLACRVSTVMKFYSLVWRTLPESVTIFLNEGLSTYDPSYEAFPWGLNVIRDGREEVRMLLAVTHQQSQQVTR